MSGPGLAPEYNFVIIDGDHLVGECSLHSLDYRSRIAQVGVCVWNPDSRRSGYGRYGAEQMIAFGFGSLGLLRLEAWILDDNAASLGLFEKLGFGYEGLLRERFLVAGKRHDMHVLGLLNTNV